MGLDLQYLVIWISFLAPSFLFLWCVFFCFTFGNCSSVESEKAYCEKRAQRYFLLCLVNIKTSPSYFGKPEWNSQQVQSYAQNFCISEYQRKRCANQDSFVPHRKDWNSFYFSTFYFSLYATEESHSLDYLYVNANTGQSSGGHSAIRLGQLVYHFQYFPDKIFHIIREPWEEFRYVYGIQENRTILIRKINLSKKNYTFLLERMNEIYLYQRKELDNLEKLQNDARIIESILSGDQTLF